jgi:16S rRNA (uracil1498-N3)-methyltransferase
MSTIRLFIPQPLYAGAVIIPPEAVLHYLLHVRRLSEGAEVQLFNGLEGEWQAVIRQPSRKSLLLEVQHQTQAQTQDAEVLLAFAPIKQGAIDFLAQKATELGVTCLQPVISHYTNNTRINIERLQANAVEAAEQSERLSVPEVRAPLALNQWLAERPNIPLIFADESGSGTSLSATLQSLPQRTPIAALIGPEGGFSPAERTLIASQNNVFPVSLGKRILRADTAALAVLAVIQLGTKPS